MTHPPTASPRLRLRISPTAETHVRAGHPWVYSDSLREQNRPGQAGELAVIYDRQDKFLAVGFFDPDSPICVRILHVGKPQTLDAAWWSARLAQALERRRGLCDAQTNGLRLINGESDGWPGLVLDRYDTILVLKIYTAAWLTRLPEIQALLHTQLTPQRIVLRLSRNLVSDSGPEAAHPTAASPSPSAPAPPSSPGPASDEPTNSGSKIIFGSPLRGPVIFRESGLQFEADVLRGQKTGFFLDQRENRRRIETLARGRTVLNAFSFSGGFSLYAARGGASAVTDLDISAHALESAQRNFALNQSDPAIAHCRHEMLQADTFHWLQGNEGRKFELIILDPPSFAKRETERAGAIRAYERLTGLGLTHLKPGGILLACSCSAHVLSDEFFGAVRLAATRSGRQFHQLETALHAADHPASFKEAEYLKAIYLRF